MKKKKQNIIYHLLKKFQVNEKKRLFKCSQDTKNPKFAERGQRLGGGHFQGWGGFSDPRDHDLCKNFGSVPKRRDQ